MTSECLKMRVNVIRFDKKRQFDKEEGIMTNPHAHISTTMFLAPFICSNLKSVSIVFGRTIAFTFYLNIWSTCQYYEHLFPQAILYLQTYVQSTRLEILFVLLVEQRLFSNMKRMLINQKLEM